MGVLSLFAGFCIGICLFYGIVVALVTLVATLIAYFIYERFFAHASTNDTFNALNLSLLALFFRSCMPELAKQAGLSPGELQALQNLSTRRGQLDDRERALDTQLQLLAAADSKVDGKIKALTALKVEIQGLLGLSDGKADAEIDRLVIVYSKMKPKDAGAIMAQLDDKVRIPVAAKMKPKDLAAILSQMPTSEAKKITETLAARFNNVKQVAESLQNPPPEPPPAPDAPAKPAPRKARRAAKAG